jgi:hypothetical protein
MATRRHGILHEVRGVNATKGYGALNRQALMRTPRMRTRTSATWSATKPSASWCDADGRAQRCSPHSYGVGPLRTDRPVVSVAEAVNHPRLRQRGTVVRHKDRLHGEFDMPGFPLRFSDFAEPLELEAALLGEYNAEVLRECGHNDKEIEMPRKESVLIEKED